MKNEKIIENLKNMGIKVQFGSNAFWDNIPYVLNKNQERTYIANIRTNSKVMSCSKDIGFEDVLRAIHYCLNDTSKVSDARSKIKYTKRHIEIQCHDDSIFNDMNNEEIYRHLSFNLEDISKNLALDILNDTLIDKYEFEELYKL